MKNRIIISMVLIVMLFATQSCTKEDVEMKSDNTYREFLSADDDPAEAKIISFINRMDLVREDPNYDNSENWNYSHDSAVWYIEASLNYKYAYPNEQRSKLLLDSMYITIDMNEEGDVNILELQNNFDLSLDTLTIKFESIDSESKFFVSIDYKLICNEDGVIQLIAYFYFGKFSVNLPDGDWKVSSGWSGNGGICGTQTYMNFDATDKLEQEEFLANDIHQLDVFYTDNETIWDMSGYTMTPTIPPFNYSPYNGYWLYGEGHYYEQTHTFAVCLTQYYMDQYVLNIIELSGKVESNESKSVEVCDVIYDQVSEWIYNPPGWKKTQLHYVSFTVANAHPRVYVPASTLML